MSNSNRALVFFTPTILINGRWEVLAIRRTRKAAHIVAIEWANKGVESKVYRGEAGGTLVLHFTQTSDGWVCS